MRIKVTQDHILRGEPFRRFTCPIALAVKEQTGRPCSIQSSRCEFLDIKNGVYLLPPEAVRFYRTFDHDSMLVKPFEFDLDIPE